MLGKYSRLYADMIEKNKSITNKFNCVYYIFSDLGFVGNKCKIVEL